MLVRRAIAVTPMLREELEAAERILGGLVGRAFVADNPDLFAALPGRGNSADCGPSPAAGEAAGLRLLRP